MRQIPRLSWTCIADLFRSDDRFGGSTHPEAFGFVPDPADRKLGDAAQAPLVTSDAGLLSAGDQRADSPGSWDIGRYGLSCADALASGENARLPLTVRRSGNAAHGNHRSDTPCVN